MSSSGTAAEVRRLLSQQRAAISRNDASSAREIVRLYAALEASVARAIAELQADAQEANLSSGADVLRWLRAEGRLRRLEERVLPQMRWFEAQVTAIVQRGQQHGAAAGAADGTALIRASFGSPLPERVPPDAILLVRPNPAALAQLVTALRDRSPLARVLRGLGGDGWQQLRDALVSGMARGAGPRQTASELARILSARGTAQLTRDAMRQLRQRALTLARTEQMRAYHQAAMDAYRANGDVVEGWVWLATVGPSTCPACLAMNGTIHPLSEDFGDHVNGRCTPAPRTKTWEDLLGADLARGIPETRLDPARDLPDAEEWLRRQSPQRQQSILGRTRYALFAQGLIDLAQMAAWPRSSRAWGNSVAVATLDELGISAADVQDALAQVFGGEDGGAAA